MKPKEYLKKYNLESTNFFNHGEFIADFASDFMTTIDLLSQNNQLSYERFKTVVKEIRQKWDGISNKTKGTGLPDKLWNYFYATVIVKTRDQFFGDMLMKQKAAHEEKQRKWKEYHDPFAYRERIFNSFFANMFHDMMSLLSSIAIPQKAFDLLGLSTDCSVEDVNKAYRLLSLKYHPDKGGDREIFEALTNAKNKCLLYLNSRSPKV